MWTESAEDTISLSLSPPLIAHIFLLRKKNNYIPILNISSSSTLHPLPSL